MTPERWKEIERLYQAALELQPSTRLQFLAENCPDVDLRSEVESLLRHRNTDSFERRALGFAGDLLGAQHRMITPGTTIDHYEVVSLIGKGGMGAVFRARDTRLGRSVAIKFSNAQFSERFEREARAISALNHPHICTLHDVGSDYMVMELVEGQTLAERLEKGGLVIEQVLEYGAQIADALAAAHAKAITHRDLKPANIMVSKNTGVKVLDFGLAKIRSQAGESLTESHVVMGTPDYMAPEQLEGREADARSDIYSLGLVLYEMATGKRVVQGRVPTLEQQPPSFAHVVERCLATDPEQRWQSAGDVKAELQWLGSARGVQTEENLKHWKPWVWAAAGVMVVAAAIVALVLIKTQTPPEQPFSFYIPIPSGVRMINRNSFSMSPDGKTIAFLAARADDVEHIWIQRVGEREARFLPGTESPSYSPPPIWSPDSKSIAFYVGGSGGGGGKLKRIEITNGSTQTICDISTFSSGGSWGANDVILFADLTRGIMRVFASGGTPVRLTTVGSGERMHGGPLFLPDGRHFLYFRGESTEVSGIYLGSIDEAPEQQDPKRLLATNTFAQIVTPKDGPTKILFLRSQALMAQDFDMASLRLVGEPVEVASPVGNSLAVSFFAASTTTLAYRAPVEQKIQLQWFDRDGKKGKAVSKPFIQQSWLALSPRGQYALVSFTESETSDIWLLGLSREDLVKLTDDPTLKGAPVWASDGMHFVFSSMTPMSNLYQGSVEGGRIEPLMASNVNKAGLSLSPDSRFLLFAAFTAATKHDLFILPIDKGKAGTPVRFVATEADESDARFSPAGPWIAYVSDETLRPEIYLRSFVPADANSTNPQSVSIGQKIPLSLAGGTHPRWSGDGREVFYSAPNGDLMTVAVSGAGTPHVGSPQVLFPMPPNSVWDVTPDGKRFLVGVPVEQNTQPPFTIVMNWRAGLKKR